MLFRSVAASVRRTGDGFSLGSVFLFLLLAVGLTGRRLNSVWITFVHPLIILLAILLRWGSWFCFALTGPATRWAEIILPVFMLTTVIITASSCLFDALVLLGSSEVGGACSETADNMVGIVNRSEERRVGKECRSRWSPYH